MSPLPKFSWNACIIDLLCFGAWLQASKAALLNFYDTLRSEPFGEKVTITVALPGFVVSEMTSGGPSVSLPFTNDFTHDALCSLLKKFQDNTPLAVSILNCFFIKLHFTSLKA